LYTVRNKKVGKKVWKGRYNKLKGRKEGKTASWKDGRQKRKTDGRKVQQVGRKEGREEGSKVRKVRKVRKEARHGKLEGRVERRHIKLAER
jgi:hypothetical protein